MKDYTPLFPCLERLTGKSELNAEEYKELIWTMLNQMENPNDIKWIFFQVHKRFIVI